jgi:TonB-dependent receptor
MNRLRFGVARIAAVAALVWACFAVQLHAQITGSGAVAGTVSNQKTRQFLKNAVVTVSGTNLSALTDSDGTFRIDDVPAGVHEVTITYTGLEPETRPVTISRGETARLNVGLKSDIYEMSQYVVAGDREGQARAINDQKNADRIKSVVASDNFGDLVDSNAAELLKSVPGFAMNYAGEDAIGFVMRGQSSVNASIMMDGNGIPNSGFGSRAVNMRNVQVNNVEAIEINRAPDASQPANSLGGSVNLISKSAFNLEGRRIRVDVGMNINTALKDFGASYQGFNHYAFAQYPTAQVNYSETFRANTDHPVGVSLSVLKGGRYRYNTQYSPSYAYVGLPSGETITANTPSVVSQVSMQEASAGFRQDYYSLNLDYKLSDNTTLYLRTYFQEGPQRHLFGINHRIVPIAANQILGTGTAAVAINGNSPNHIDSRPNSTPVGPGSSSGSRIQKTTGHEVSENQVYNLNLGGKSHWREVTFDYNGYYGRDFYRNPIAGFTKGGTLSYDVTNVGFTMDNLQSESQMTLNQTSGPDYRSIANYGRLTWSATNTSYIDWKYGGRANARQELNKWKFPVVLQAGAAYDVQRRANSRTGDGGRYTFGSGPDGAFGTADDVDLPVATLADEHMPNRWNMHGFPTIDPGQFIDMAKLADYVAAHPEAATLDPVQDVINYYGTRKDMKEEIDALYFMATVRFGTMSLVPGVRWERTADTGSGFLRRGSTPTDPAYTPQQKADIVKAQYSAVSRDVTYDDFYPNLQGRYNVTPNMILRAAYTQTIGRPNFSSTLPGDTINDTNRTISRNNPALKPFTADNYDLTAEYYFKKSTGSITASLFRKDIQNYFQNTTFVLPGGADNGYDGEYEGYTVTEQRNIADTTRTDGFELGYQQALRFLPGILRNFTASASYTHVHATTPPGTRAATGVYPDVYNLGLTYNDVHLRVDLRYNMRKSWLNAINNTTGERDYFRDNDRVDLAIDYRFNQRYAVYFDWRNFTNEEDLRFVGPNARVKFHQTAGMSINAGVRADF